MSDTKKTEHSQPRSKGKGRRDRSKKRRVPTDLVTAPTRQGVLNPFFRSDLRKLADCVKLIMEFQSEWAKASSQSLSPGTYSGLNVYDQRRTEQRKRLAAQAHADLIEIISNEVGSGTIQRFPELYWPS